MLKDKVAIIVVTYNHPVLLQHSMELYAKYNPEYDCDFIIVDNSSTDTKQLKLLDKLAEKHTIMQAPNDRVESSFQLAYNKFKDQYKYYFFCHDDCMPMTNGWLKSFIDRLHSGYCEEIIKGTEISKLPIGKVGALTQFWRSYSSIMQYPVQCLFLEQVIKLTIPEDKIPKIFKYTDCDRVLITNECLKSTNGLRNLNEYRELQNTNKELFDKICNVLAKYLPYYDEGMYPNTLYPAGAFWNKLTLTTEFMNSIDPLINGFRTVGLQDEGYLEQIHGYDSLISHDIICHMGAPNFKEHMAKVFNTDSKEITKNFNNKAMLLKYNKITQDYFRRK